MTGGQFISTHYGSGGWKVSGFPLGQMKEVLRGNTSLYAEGAPRPCYSPSVSKCVFARSTHSSLPRTRAIPSTGRPPSRTRFDPDLVARSKAGDIDASAQMLIKAGIIESLKGK